MQLEIFRDGVPERTTIEPLQPGAAGNLHELAIMAQMVRDATPQADLRAFVMRSVVPDVPGHQFQSEIRNCFLYARDKITYRRDPVGVEILADLWSILYAIDPEQPVGDCKKKSTFLASCLGILGVVSGFVAMTQQPDDTEFHHVYVAAVDDVTGEHTALDPTPEDAKIGWEAKATNRIWFPIFEDI